MHNVHTHTAFVLICVLHIQTKEFSIVKISYCDLTFYKKNRKHLNIR